MIKDCSFKVCVLCFECTRSYLVPVVFCFLYFQILLLCHYEIITHHQEKKHAAALIVFLSVVSGVWSTMVNNIMSMYCESINNPSLLLLPLQQTYIAEELPISYQTNLKVLLQSLELVNSSH